MKIWNQILQILQKRKKKEPLPPQMKEQRLSQFLIQGIILSSVCLFGSLTITIFPNLPQKTASGIHQSIMFVQSGLEYLGFSLSAAATQHTSTTALASQDKTAPPVRAILETEDVSDGPDSNLAETEDSDLDIVTEPVSEDSTVYNAVLGTSLGPMIYYNQGDTRWRDYLYGGADPMHTYGCGPTTVAMLINSFSPQQAAVTPVDMADWAAANGDYAPQGGSYRSLIPNALSAYGLNVTSVKDRSVANASALLDSGHVLVALMGRGTLTQSGHFIIITQCLEDGTVSIADPNSLENSEKPWDLELLMRELKKVSDSGAPLWAVSR